MGKLEIESRKRQRKANIQHAILNTIYAAGFMSAVIVAPNALQVLRQFDNNYYKKKYREAVVSRSVGRLLDHGLIEFETTKRGKFVRLTPKGEAKLRRLDLSQPRALSKKKWDGKWRIVIFDIREYRRLTRDKLRHSLTNVGFLRLQNSVWIYPHDCEDLIVLLKADFRIGKDVLYIIADQVENDKWLRDHFGIKNKK